MCGVDEHGARFRTSLQRAGSAAEQSTALAMAPTTVSSCAACAGDADTALPMDVDSDDVVTPVLARTVTAAVALDAARYTSKTPT